MTAHLTKNKIVLNKLSRKIRLINYLFDFRRSEQPVFLRKNTGFIKLK